MRYTYQGESVLHPCLGCRLLWILSLICSYANNISKYLVWLVIVPAVSYLTQARTSTLTFITYKYKLVFVCISRCVGATEVKRVARNLGKFLPIFYLTLCGVYTTVESPVVSCTFRWRSLDGGPSKYQQTLVLFESSFQKSVIVFLTIVNNLNKAE